MVERVADLDLVFGSLAHPVRRDILRRGARERLTVGEMARSYDLSFAAVSKHIKILERARLVTKRRRGREQVVELSRDAFIGAADYLKEYEQLWNSRFDRLERYLAVLPKWGGKQD